MAVFVVVVGDHDSAGAVVCERVPNRPEAASQTFFGMTLLVALPTTIPSFSVACRTVSHAVNLNEITPLLCHHDLLAEPHRLWHQQTSKLAGGGAQP